MKRIALICLTLAMALPLLHAQEVHYGFRAGLNFSQLDGPVETDSDGNALEHWDLSSGFNVGALFTFRFVDRFGARTGLSFEQKGSR
ncbi:MAG: PorT family protein, partial [Bacteroidetes bacterium]